MDASTPPPLRERCLQVIAAGVVLALLYVGRDVLIPFVGAIMLSLLLAPLVRVLTRLGLARLPSVLVTVVALILTCLAGALALGTQAIKIAQNVPEYRATVHHKLDVIDTVTHGRLTLLTGEARRFLEAGPAAEAIAALTPATPQESQLDLPPEFPGADAAPGIRGRPDQPAARPLHLLGKILSSAWAAAQAVGIVLLVLVFVLLERESLRDRFIRLVGSTDIRMATLALNDAGERLSRFFVSQFAVNLAFGLAIALSLTILQVQQATLFGTLAAVLRFVPYVGVVFAALFSAAVTFAVGPGWALAIATLAVFILLDLVVGQLLEPQLYGHATGLSPLAVVVAAIFWSSLWGPVGLILSTPLTLCLVVAGRHIKSLGVLELLLSDSQALTPPQRFYQRALSGDSHEIIREAGAFLKRSSLTAYCDLVLIPALHLARLDADVGATNELQAANIRRVVVAVISALSNSGGLKLPKRRYGGSVLEDVNVGQWLRQQRELVSGRWQGPLGVQPGSVVLCIGLGSQEDDLVAELFARILLGKKLDARHFSPTDLNLGLPAGANPDGVSLVYLMSAFPSAERARADSLEAAIRSTLPHAHVIRVFGPGVAERPHTHYPDTSTVTASSLTQALEMCSVVSQQLSRPVAHLESST